MGISNGRIHLCYCLMSWWSLKLVHIPYGHNIVSCFFFNWFVSLRTLKSQASFQKWIEELRLVNRNVIRHLVYLKISLEIIICRVKSFIYQYFQLESDHNQAPNDYWCIVLHIWKSISCLNVCLWFLILSSIKERKTPIKWVNWYFWGASFYGDNQ